eukprot:COSAG02_NODE_1043_length_15014_cov_8.766007_6_plen_298_part_00
MCNHVLVVHARARCMHARAGRARFFTHESWHRLDLLLQPNSRAYVLVLLGMRSRLYAPSCRSIQTLLQRHRDRGIRPQQAARRGSSTTESLACDKFVHGSSEYHGNGDSELNTAARARDSWFNGMHAPTPGTHSLRDADLYGTLHEKHVRLSPETLAAMYDDVRDRTLRSLGDLEDMQLVGEMESSLNPMIWAVGHNAHFYETMVVRLLWPNMQVRSRWSQLLPPYRPTCCLTACFPADRFTRQGLCLMGGTWMLRLTRFVSTIRIAGTAKGSRKCRVERTEATHLSRRSSTAIGTE